MVRRIINGCIDLAVRTGYVRPRPETYNRLITTEPVPVPPEIAAPPEISLNKALEDMRAGRVKEFKSAGHPVASGVKMTLRYPADWDAREIYDEPGVLQCFSVRGQNFYCVCIRVTPIIQRLTEADWALGITPQYLTPPQDPENHKNTFYEATTVAGRVPAAIIERWEPVTDEEGDYKQLSRILTFYQRRASVVVALYVTDLMNKEKEQEADHFRTLARPFFDEIVKSITLKY